MNVAAMVTGLLGLVIGILILTSLATTVVDNTYTGDCNTLRANDTGCELDNASATGKTMYSLLELLYPIIGVIIMVSVGFAMKSRFD